jgi:hypothetical protein
MLQAGDSLLRALPTDTGDVDDQGMVVRGPPDPITVATRADIHLCSGFTLADQEARRPAGPSVRQRLPQQRAPLRFAGNADAQRGERKLRDHRLVGERLARLCASKLQRNRAAGRQALGDLSFADRVAQILVLVNRR